VDASIYLHIPFCAGACGYCDFYSVSAGRDESRLDDFVDNLLHVVLKSIQSGGFDGVPTVYIGGGTPSLLGPERIGRLLGQILAALPAVPEEVTVEANPESLSPAFIEACAASGATRLSIGCQTLHERSRRAVSRIGAVSCVRRAVSDVARLFPGSFSLDFISALPYQTEAILEEDLSFACGSGADHVSLYALTLAEGTPLDSAVRRGDLSLPDPDSADALWIRGRDFLEERGFRQYEVSNFSRPGAESAHNMRYWRLENYLAFGPGAVGTIVDEEALRAVRTTWPADADLWCAPGVRGEAPDEERISTRDLVAESAIMGFRLRAGVPNDVFERRFGVPVRFFYGKTLDAWRDRGLAVLERPALNPAGLLLLDRFLVECLSELDSTYPRYEERRR
jgi:oxygen-independent coproporphyrinogen-3 oxidase